MNNIEYKILTESSIGVYLEGRKVGTIRRCNRGAFGNGWQYITKDGHTGEPMSSVQAVKKSIEAD